MVAGLFVNLTSNVASFRSTRRGGSFPDTPSSTKLAIVCDNALKQPAAHELFAEHAVIRNRSVDRSAALIHHRSYQPLHGLAFDNP
jgi:hypothetical protein